MTGDDLLQNIKNRGGYPASAVVSLTDANIMTAATEELWSYIVPWIESANEEFFTDYVDIPLVAGQAAYTMPSRAAGQSLRAIKYVDVNGNENDPLVRIEMGDAQRYSSVSGNVPFGFWYSATSINVLPAPNTSTGCIRPYFARRPGALVNNVVTSSLTTQVGIISSVTAGTITLNANHNGWPATAGTVDLISATNPYGAIDLDVPVSTAVSGTATISVTAWSTGLGITKGQSVYANSQIFTAQTSGTTAGSGTGPASATTYNPYVIDNNITWKYVAPTFDMMAINTGDYVTAKQTSYVPCVPVEWHSLLELRTVARAFGVIGDMAGQAEVLRAAEEMRRNLLGLSQPRSSFSNRKISAWR